MSDWVCYLITSLDSNCTYIGASNNQQKRLSNHNKDDPNIKRTGAKRTRGQTWITILVISGFDNKNSCLSFESGWKRLAKTRNNNKLFSINQLTDNNFKYYVDPKWNRIIDLLFWVHHLTNIGNKFILNYSTKYPYITPNNLTINVFSEKWIIDLPWPFFIDFFLLTLQ